MKKILYSVLLLSGLSLFSACSNGDYNVSPDGTAGSTSVNPLHALTSSEFTWTGTGTLSAIINGTPWISTATTYTDAGGQSVIYGVEGSSVFVLYIQNSASVGSVTGMGYNQFGASGYYLDSAGLAMGYAYYSNLGNSGEMLLTNNTSTNIAGKFYFQGVNSTGASVSVSDGAFNVNK